MIIFSFPFGVSMVAVLIVCAVGPVLFFLLGLKVLCFSLFYCFCSFFGMVWGWFFIGLLCVLCILHFSIFLFHLRLL